MKIRKVEKRNEFGYTFEVGHGPFWISGWWFNQDKNNVVPPSYWVEKRRFSIVRGHPATFGKVRNLIRYMVAHDLVELNTDQFLLPPWLDKDKSDAVDAASVEAEPVYGKDRAAADVSEDQRWEKYFTKPMGLDKLDVIGEHHDFLDTDTGLSLDEDIA